MKNAFRMLIINCLVSGLISAQIIQQKVEDREKYMATVEVLAFDTEGHFLGSPSVRIFESDDHKDLAGNFQAGRATHVPFGIYRLEAYMDGFYPETREVAIYQQQVTIVAGLLFGREGLTLPIVPRVNGRVVGSLPKGKLFARMIGIFSNRSLESGIGTDGQFDFGVPWEGRYLLLVIGEGGVLASKPIQVPYEGSQIEITVSKE